VILLYLAENLLKCSPQAGLGQHLVVVFAGELAEAVDPT